MLLPDDVEDRFVVLVVCSANLYRSPLAEHLLRRGVAPLGLNWAISSAGVMAAGGDPLGTRVTGQLHSVGVDVQNWVTTALSVDGVLGADLVLTATESHRAAVARLAPAAARYSFTLRQFARLVTASAPPRDPARDPGPDLVIAAQAARALVQPPRDGSDDIADPAGRSVYAFRRCVDVTQAAVDSIAAAMPLPTPSTPPPVVASGRRSSGGRHAHRPMHARS